MTEISDVVCYILGVKGKFRGDGLVEELERRGIHPRVFYGVDGNSPEGISVKERVDQAASRLIQGRDMSLGEVACALGHLAIQEDFFSKSQSEWALIFEDDVVLHGDMNCIIARLSALKGPTVIQLHKSIPDDKTVLLRKKIEVQQGTATEPRIYLRRKLNFSSGAYAYLMNREAAEVADRASKGRKIINIPDWPYLWRHKVNFWELNFNLAGYEGESLLDKERRLSSQVLGPTFVKHMSFAGRLAHFGSNVLLIHAIKFHKLGYPGRVLYFNNVVMPFKRRIVQFGMKFASIIE